MAKLSPLQLLTDAYSSIGILNGNFAKLTTALSNTLSRDGSSPNQMAAVLDMNNNRILNLADPQNNFDAANKYYVDERTGNAPFYADLAEQAALDAQAQVALAAAQVALAEAQADISTDQAVIATTQAGIATAAASGVVNGSLVTSAATGGTQSARRLDNWVTNWHVEAFGAVATSSVPSGAVMTANVAAFNAAFAAAKAFGGGTVHAGSKSAISYYLNGTVTIDPSMCGFHGHNSKLDFSQLASGNAIHINHTASVQFGHTQFCFEQAWIVGPSTSPGTVGMYFDSSANNKSSRLTVYNCYVQNFGTNVDLRNRAYLLQFYNCVIKNATYNIYHPGGVTDAGENISFHKCTISGGGKVYMGNGNGSLVFDTCSFDYNQTSGWIEVGGGHVFCTNCHFEDNIANGGLAISPFIVANASGATLVINGGDMVMIGTLPHNLPSIIDIGASGYAKFQDVFIHNMRTIGGNFKSGTGKLRMVGTRGFTNSGGNSYLNDISDTEMNVMADGSFEGADIGTNVNAYTGYQHSQDLMTITSDSLTNTNSRVAITNRYTGTNVKLTYSSTEARTGTKSLRIEKVSNLSTLCQAFIFAPITPGCTPVGQFWYKNPLGLSSIFVGRYWVKINGYDANGIPLMVKSVQVGGLTVPNTNVDWTAFTMRGDQSMEAPMWATHLAIEVNMFSSTAGFFYIDDFVMNLT